MLGLGGGWSQVEGTVKKDFQEEGNSEQVKHSLGQNSGKEKEIRKETMTR